MILAHVDKGSNPFLATRGIKMNELTISAPTLAIIGGLITCVVGSAFCLFKTIMAEEERLNQYRQQVESDHWKLAMRLQTQQDKHMLATNKYLESMGIQPYVSQLPEATSGKSGGTGTATAVRTKKKCMSS
jgi:hypothetical protein